MKFSLFLIFLCLWSNYSSKKKSKDYKKSLRIRYIDNDFVDNNFEFKTRNNLPRFEQMDSKSTNSLNTNTKYKTFGTDPIANPPPKKEVTYRKPIYIGDNEFGFKSISKDFNLKEDPNFLQTSDSHPLPFAQQDKKDIDFNSNSVEYDSSYFNRKAFVIGEQNKEEKDSNKDNNTPEIVNDIEETKNNIITNQTNIDKIKHQPIVSISVNQTESVNQNKQVNKKEPFFSNEKEINNLSTKLANLFKNILLEVLKPNNQPYDIDAIIDNYNPTIQDTLKSSLHKFSKEKNNEKIKFNNDRKLLNETQKLSIFNNTKTTIASFPHFHKLLKFKSFEGFENSKKINNSIPSPLKNNSKIKNKVPVPINNTTVDNPVPINKKKIDKPVPVPINKTKIDKPVPVPINKKKVGNPAPAPINKKKVGNPAPAPINKTKVGNPAPAPSNKTKVGNPAPVPSNKTKVGNPVPVPPLNNNSKKLANTNSSLIKDKTNNTKPTSNFMKKNLNNTKNSNKNQTSKIRIDNDTSINLKNDSLALSKLKSIFESGINLDNPQLKLPIHPNINYRKMNDTKSLLKANKKKITSHSLNFLMPKPQSLDNSKVSELLPDVLKSLIINSESTAFRDMSKDQKKDNLEKLIKENANKIKEKLATTKNNSTVQEVEGKQEGKAEMKKELKIDIDESSVISDILKNFAESLLKKKE